MLTHLAKKPDHGGSMCRLEAPAAQMKDFPIFADLGMTTDAGTEPWLMTYRSSQWRYGPSHWPLPGLGALVLPVSEGVKHTFLSAPYEELLKCGIALPDLQTFLGTDSGVKFAEAHLVQTKLCVGTAMWLPPGWFALPLACDLRPQGNDATEKDEDDPVEKGVGMAVVLSVFAQDWCSSVGETWKQIARMNNDHLESVSEKRIWTSRVACFQKFAKEVTDKLTT